MLLQLDALKRDLEQVGLTAVNGQPTFYNGKYLFSVDWGKSTYSVTNREQIQEKEKQLREILATHGLTEESLIYIRAKCARGKWWYTFFMGIKPEAILGETASD